MVHQCESRCSYCDGTKYARNFSASNDAPGTPIKSMPVIVTFTRAVSSSLLGIVTEEGIIAFNRGNGPAERSGLLRSSMSRYNVPTQATQSSTVASNRAQNLQPQNTPTYALHLTDGVTTIKAVEIGSKYNSHGRSPEECFRTGAKVKLRGPLKLLKGVLMLPAGSISSPEATSQSENAQCRLLGGEVEFADPTQNEPDLILQRELLTKLDLPPDNPPEWFPGRRVLPVTNSSEERSSTVIGTDHQPSTQTATEQLYQPPDQQNNQNRPLKRILFSTDESTNQPSVNSTHQTGPIQTIRPQTSRQNPHPLIEEIPEEQIEAEALFDDDDYLLASAVENFENMASTSTGDTIEGK
nr:hypothetical transcript [Hymenolepis microstoma]